MEVNPDRLIEIIGEVLESHKTKIEEDVLFILEKFITEADFAGAWFRESISKKIQNLIFLICSNRLEEKKIEEIKTFFSEIALPMPKTKKVEDNWSRIWSLIIEELIPENRSNFRNLMKKAL